MRSGILLLLVVLALAALAALLWWRFKGSGQATAPEAVQATRNHHSLRTFHYGPASIAQKVTESEEVAPAGAALAQLLPEEDLDHSAPELTDEEMAAAEAAQYPESAGEEEAEATSATQADESPRPASIRHATGAVASLLDTLDEAPVPGAPASEPAPEADEEPADSLYFNPLTAPAPTANDQANRAAEIALRQQRRARMSAGAAAQRTALTGLFPGAGSPVPTPNPT